MDFFVIFFEKKKNMKTRMDQMNHWTLSWPQKHKKMIIIVLLDTLYNKVFFVFSTI